MESKFKVGDRVRVLDCPVMLDVVGKSGVIRHRQGDLYRVEVDGKVIPDYALEADIELIPANPFLESNELISKLLKENNLEIMHLEMYLDTQNPWRNFKDERPKPNSHILRKMIHPDYKAYGKTIYYADFWGEDRPDKWEQDNDRVVYEWQYINE
jgi:hypothetical protein